MIKEYSKEEVNNLPLLRYNGKTVFITRQPDVKDALLEIQKHEIVGFDTESKPAFRKGEYNPIALVQIATPAAAYLFRINKIGLDQALIDFFCNDRYLKIGIGLKDDLRDLQKIRRFEPKSFFDLSMEANRIGLVRTGARNLCATFLHHRISKSQQTSNWENDELTAGQVVYAATDAWVCLKIYDEMDKQDLL